ncbi:zinc finger BED domain-containing protein RICESLEEPER 2-like isoform X2 [Vicia villosa]|nr:zinc finger BED domain-containing protein RICESLEEPER 2-like isoform X2 [Vicia villosa]XP_058777232.1 zinc finger BED domain-containing protein RICESLEEPER 2-like isoform X2 [Vicia villosa]
MDQGQHSMEGVLEQGQCNLRVQPNQNLPVNEIGSTAMAAPVAPELVDAQPSKKRKSSASGSRQSSACWEHFIRLPDDLVDAPTAACKHCHKKYLCDPRTHGTTNLNHHIKKCPKMPLAVSTDPTQTILTYPTVDGDLAQVSSRFDKKACRSALSIFVVLDELPFSAVEREGFKFYSKVMQPQFSIPSRRTVARDCFQLHLDEKEKLKAFFKSDCNRVALTTDCWNSLQNLNYLTLTAHFVDNEWKYQKRIISFAVIPDHKGGTVGRKIEEVLKDWGIRNVSTITVDNATANDVAVTYLKKKIANMNGLMGDGECFHMRCSAHILNLVVNEGLKDKHLAVTSVRDAVRFVKSSPQRGAKFKECIEFAEITCKKLVCLDVLTRWNATYLMLEAAEKFQFAFEKLEDEDSSYREFFGKGNPPSSDDWDIARAFSDFLKLFYDATKIFSTSQNVSLHTCFHQVSSIYCELQQAIMNLNYIFASVGGDMMEKYNKYWGSADKMNKMIYFGIILDPRYKLRFIEWTFKDMYGVESKLGNDLLKAIKESLQKLYDWYNQAYDQKLNSGQPLGSGGQASNSDTNATAVCSSVMARAEAFEQHLEEQDSIDQENELEGYNSTKCVKKDPNFDILIWWKHNSAQYPVLSTMAKDILATPVSTVASESAFSTGGRVIETYRTSLTAEMAEALICTQNWLKPSFTYFKDMNLMEDFELSEDIVTEFQEMSARARGGSGNSGVSSSHSQPQPSGCA